MEQFIDTLRELSVKPSLISELEKSVSSELPFEEAVVLAVEQSILLVSVLAKTSSSAAVV